MAYPYDGGKRAASVVCSGWPGRGIAWFHPALPLQIVVNSHVIFEVAAEGSMESLRPQVVANVLPLPNSGCEVTGHEYGFR